MYKQANKQTTKKESKDTLQMFVPYQQVRGGLACHLFRLDLNEIPCNQYIILDCEQSFFFTVSHARERASSGEAARREKRGRKPEKKKERLPAQPEPMKYALASQRKTEYDCCNISEPVGTPLRRGVPWYFMSPPADEWRRELTWRTC